MTRHGHQRVRERLAEQLDSHDVARIIYGTIVGLALVLALALHPPSAAQTTGLIVATAIAIGLAEVYSELVAGAARRRDPHTGRQMRRTAHDAIAVTFGAAFPAIFFALASAGVIDLKLAFNLSKWTGVGLICGYGYLAARLGGLGVGRALLHAALVGAVGGALVTFKSLLH